MKKSYQIILVFILFCLAVILLFNFIKTPEYSFAKNATEKIKTCDKAKYIYTPDAVAKIVLKKDTNTFLVDVRSKHEYDKGHLPKAIHIAKSAILDKENYTFFKALKKKNQQVVFYGNSVVEANIPFMVLKQMGIDNMGISCESYDFLSTKNWEELAQTKSLYPNDETPVVNFAQFIALKKQQILEKKELAKKKKIIKKRITIPKRKILVKAKKVPEVEEEEDEGC